MVNEVTPSPLVSTHYGQNSGKIYLDTQHDLMRFGGMANKQKFASYIKPTDTVLDFGCGAGYLLEQLDCKEKLGVEVNPHAIPLAQQKGITVFTRTEDVPSASVDVVISNHALEHTKRPLDEVFGLLRVLKPGGLLVLVVPCESINRPFWAQDINHHLYTWSPMNLGHLLLEAGYAVQECGPYWHKWPPHYQWIVDTLGWGAFNLIARAYSRWSRDLGQIRAVAQRNLG